MGPLRIHVTSVEPGYFRTDLLDGTSLGVSPLQIGDYAATAGVVRAAASQLSHAQPGDPAKLAEVLIAFADAPNPPVRLPLGSDTVAAIEDKLTSDAALLAAWRAVSVSTGLWRNPGRPREHDCDARCCFGHVRGSSDYPRDRVAKRYCAAW